MLNCTLPNSAKYSAQQVLLNPFSFIYLQLYKWTTAFSRLSVEFSEPTTVKNLWSPQVKMHSVKNYVGPELRKHKLFQKRMHQPISLTLIYLFVSLFVCLFVLSFEAGSQHIALAGLNATRLINQAGLKLKSGWSVSQMLRLKACATTNKWSGKCSLESQFC